MLVFWVDFKAQAANLSSLVSQKSTAPCLQPGLSLLSTLSESDGNNQQNPGGTTPHRPSLMLRVLALVLSAPEGSVCPKPLPPRSSSVRCQGVQKLCPHGHNGFSSYPPARVLWAADGDPSHGWAVSGSGLQVVSTHPPR